MRIIIIFVSLSSAGASSPAAPANGESRRRSDKSTADSQLFVGSVVHGASNLSCRPWERGDLLRRLSTFKLAGKKPKVSVAGHSWFSCFMQ